MILRDRPDIYVAPAVKDDSVITPGLINMNNDQFFAELMVSGSYDFFDISVTTTTNGSGFIFDVSDNYIATSGVYIF
jgi:hypothetical protein